MFIESAFNNPYFFFSWVLIIVFSICVHEFAHAQVALWKGDDTAANNGHLSLNPLVQMGWMSLLLLALVGIAWGSVPVNPRQLRGRSAHAQVAFAGPAANLILCALFSVLGGLLELAGFADEIIAFLMMAGMANAVLFLFNMLPIPMFDGWTVLALWVPPMARIDVRMASNYSWMALIVIWSTGIMDGIWGIGAVMSGTVQHLVLLAFGG